MSRKKLLVALSSLGLAICSTALYAHVPAAGDNTFRIAIPDLRQGLELSLTGLALMPGANNLNYVIYNKELPVQSPTWTEKEIHPDFDGAFTLGARYVFPEGKDVSLTWTHLNTSTSTSVAAPNDQYFLGPDYEIGPDGLDIRNAHGKAKFDYDVINLDAGQFIDVGRHIEMRFFGGLSNVYLREHVTAVYSGTVGDDPGPAGPFSTEQKVTANFTGIGPRVGIQTDYLSDFYGIGVTGQAAVSALIGDTYAKTKYYSSAPLLMQEFGQEVNEQFIKDKRVTQVIPAIDTKLGLFYKQSLGNCMQLKLEGGYQAAVYINAINQYLPASLVEPLETGGIFVDTMSHTQSNYSVQGPYFTAALQF